MNESSNSVLNLVKKVSQTGTKDMVIARREYDLLIEELWASDAHLKMRYATPSVVPRIYSLYGVKINIAEPH
jgi:hypothetical protein